MLMVVYVAASYRNSYGCLMPIDLLPTSTIRTYNTITPNSFRPPSRVPLSSDTVMHLLRIPTAVVIAGATIRMPEHSPFQRNLPTKASRRSDPISMLQASSFVAMESHDTKCEHQRCLYI